MSWFSMEYPNNSVLMLYHKMTPVLFKVTIDTLSIHAQREYNVIGEKTKLNYWKKSNNTLTLGMTVLISLDDQVWLLCLIVVHILFLVCQAKKTDHKVANMH